MFLRALTLALALGALGVLAPEAMAQEDVAAEKDRQARDLYRNGKVLYDEGRYEEAIQAWEQSWALSERPQLLYNLSNAYERAGRYVEALDRLHTYRIFATEEERDTITARIRNLEERAATQREEQDQQAEALQDAQRREAEAEAERVRLEAALAEERARQQAEASKGGLPVAPVAVTGVGVAGLVLGIVGHAGAQSRFSSLDESCVGAAVGTLCPSSASGELDALRSKQIMAYTGYGLAVLGLGGGAALFALGHKGSSDLWLAPAQGGATLGVSGAW